MYTIIKNVLDSGNYDLTTMLKKIKQVWVENDLTDAEYAELCQRARDGAKFENSVNMLEKLFELDRRVKILENTGINNNTVEEYPAYVPGKYYYTDDKCSFENKNYVCTAPENVVCVWSPIEYPAYWDEV